MVGLSSITRMRFGAMSCRSPRLPSPGEAKPASGGEGGRRHGAGGGVEHEHEHEHEYDGWGTVWPRAGGPCYHPRRSLVWEKVGGGLLLTWQRPLHLDDSVRTF